MSRRPAPGRWLQNCCACSRLVPDEPATMRRGSMAMVGGGGEPLIVVEESGAEEAEYCSRTPSLPRGLSVEDSPPDPYHLSPWRDTRKHSLPTPSCTTGPTASQVRRLSERGEGVAKEAREVAFLATLSQVQPQTAGGRRHSVVTISRVPQALFGRGRRESIAAFPALSRRNSGIKCPPATDTLGSSHNLQLDIMDDIVQARKVRMRLWNTSSERLCEVQPLDERSPHGGAATSVRYAAHRGRRHSDFVGVLPPIPARRRASDMPGPPPVPPRAAAAATAAATVAAAAAPAGGVVCTDTELRRILEALSSSATEIDRCGAPVDARRRLADTRSSSFDASALRECPTGAGTAWFAQRHQTLAIKKKGEPKKPKVTFAPDPKRDGDSAAVLWDGPSGSVVDAGALGSAIEVFLRKSGEAPAPAVATAVASAPGPSREARPPLPPRTAGERWGSDRPDEEAAQGCDATLCNTIKDLFV